MKAQQQKSNWNEIGKQWCQETFQILWAWKIAMQNLKRFLFWRIGGGNKFNVYFACELILFDSLQIIIHHSCITQRFKTALKSFTILSSSSILFWLLSTSWFNSKILSFWSSSLWYTSSTSSFREHRCSHSTGSVGEGHFSLSSCMSSPIIAGCVMTRLMHALLWKFA